MAIFTVKAENVVFDTATDLIDFSIKGGAVKDAEFSKLIYAIDYARITRADDEDNNILKQGNGPVISDDVLHEMDTMKFEDILQYVHTIQKGNDLKCNIKCILSFALGFGVGRIIPKFGKFI